MSRISDPEMADIVIDAPVPRKPDREARYLDNEVLVGFDTEWDAKNKETTPLLSLQFATYRIEPDGCRGSLVSRWYEPPGPRVRCDELVEYVIRFLDDVGVKQMAKTRGGSRVVSVVLLAHFAQAEISMIENPLRDVVIQQIAGKAHHGRLPDYSSFFVFSIGEMEAIIAALPEYATSKRSGLRFPVRARFVIAWEYALRPQTLNRLSVPEHYRQGAVDLVISDAIDKNRFGRPLAVSSGARNALDSVIPAKGSIFGAHDFRTLLRKAAHVAGIDAYRADRISDYDFRHSRLTYLGQVTSNLSGVMYIAGHKQPATTARYMRPQRAAADDVLAAAQAAADLPELRPACKGADMVVNLTRNAAADEVLMAAVAESDLGDRAG